MYKGKNDVEREEYVNAQYDMGYQYLHGEGTDIDYGKAMECFKKTSEGGDSRAKNIIGTMYFRGMGVEKNPEEAYEWFKESASCNNGAGICNLAGMYLHGIGTEKDREMAIELYSLAMLMGGEATKRAGKALRDLGEKDRFQNPKAYKLLYDSDTDIGTIIEEILEDDNGDEYIED